MYGSRRGRSGFYGYTNIQTPDIHIMPFTDIDNFPNDSSNDNLGITMIKLNVDDKNINLSCYNAEGIQTKYKKKLPKVTQALQEVNQE